MKLLITAGGTGGHIFPGIAVAEAFAGPESGNDVVFAGTRQGLESKIIPQYGYRLLSIEARQFLGKSLIHKVFTLLNLIWGIYLAMGMIKREKPDAILGMGGFTSIPVVLAGAFLRVPSFIHEQNVQPGLANRVLSKFVKGTFVSFDETKEYLENRRVFHVGNPLRKRLLRPQGTKEEGIFGIFVFGGSRGARSINESVLTLLPYMEPYKNVVIYHQTGPDDFERIKEAYSKSSISHEVFPFTDNMERYYRLSDVVISRAGASTIFELAYFKRAAILIPYPFSAGGHQWKNASYVEGLGGGYLIGDDEASGERLHDALKHLMREPELIREMGENIGRIYKDDAAEQIVRGIFHGIS
jgi:UDP-N-acetylglucosamine--N-acetylmuramyl-(pentapeptide) pyrophosphoryl-undecaprenol N-acetylglucosamine transferase